MEGGRGDYTSNLSGRTTISIPASRTGRQKCVKRLGACRFGGLKSSGCSDDAKGFEGICDGWKGVLDCEIKSPEEGEGCIHVAM